MTRQPSKGLLTQSPQKKGAKKQVVPETAGMTTLADGAVRVCGTEYQGLEPVLGVELRPEEGLVRRLSEARPELVQVDPLERDGAAREDEPRVRAPAGRCEAATPATVRPRVDPEPGLGPDPSEVTIVYHHRTIVHEEAMGIISSSSSARKSKKP